MAATDFALVTFSVLYSMLPAQLVSFSGVANEESSSGMAAAAVQSLMKVRFFMVHNSLFRYFPTPPSSCMNGLSFMADSELINSKLKAEGSKLLFQCLNQRA